MTGVPINPLADPLGDWRAPDHAPQGIDTARTLVPVRTARVLCVDPSLANAGWAVLDATEGEGFKVLLTGMVKTEPGTKTGLRDSYDRAEEQFGEWVEVLRKATRMACTEVVHEMPAVGMRKSRNVEAPHVACMALRLACRVEAARTPVMLNAQQVRKVVVGRASADKKDVRRVVEREVAGCDEMTLWNYDITDAVALGMAYALKEA